MSDRKAVIQECIAAIKALGDYPSEYEAHKALVDLLDASPPAPSDDAVDVLRKVLGVEIPYPEDMREVEGARRDFLPGRGHVVYVGDTVVDVLQADLRAEAGRIVGGDR